MAFVSYPVGTARIANEGATVVPVPSRNYGICGISIARGVGTQSGKKSGNTSLPAPPPGKIGICVLRVALAAMRRDRVARLAYVYFRG
jgi:hypothetical protein